MASSCSIDDGDPQANCVWSWSISVTYLYDDSDGGEFTAAAGHGWFQPIEAHTRTHTTTGTPRPS